MEGFERSHRRLLVWKEAVELAGVVYTITDRFPESERFGLTLQMRRAVTSIASNIAEGAGRSTSADKLRFFIMARGSLTELDTQMEIARKVKLPLNGKEKEFEDRLNQLSRLLSGLIRARREK